MKTEIPYRDGISWFDDNLGSVASQAACELDAVRVGYVYHSGLAHVQVLVTWLARVARGEAPSYLFAENLIRRAAEAWKPDRPKMRTMDEVRAFARDAAEAIGHATTTDPTANGWTRVEAMHFCLELSKRGCVDRHFGRRGGSWRGDYYS